MQTATSSLTFGFCLSNEVTESGSEMGLCKVQGQEKQNELEGFLKWELMRLTYRNLKMRRQWVGWQQCQGFKHLWTFPPFKQRQKMSTFR